MYKSAGKNLQRRANQGKKPRRGLRKKSLGPVYPTSPAKNSDSEYLNKILEREAKSRLREAPVAGAPIPGERAADEERLRAIKMRQRQEEEKRRARIQKQKNKRR
jgi:hypothetical protein